MERKSFGNIDDFLGEKAPPLSDVSNIWKASILSRRDIEGLTWYLIKVNDCGEERFYMKSTDDLQDLDRTLRSPAFMRTNNGRPPPMLPAVTTGLNGLAFQLGKFLGGEEFHANQIHERRQTFQIYL